MNFRKTFQGALVISQMHEGQLIERQYMGYTKREAVALFKAHLAKITGKTEKPWTPKVYEDFYCLHTDGSIISRNRTHSIAHQKIIDSGNCFKTRAECENHFKQQGMI